MEEEWIKYKELMEVNELVTQEETLKEEKKIWEEILKNENFEYKFKIDMPVADDSVMSLKEIKRKKKYARCKSRIKEYQHANNASKKR